MIKIVLRGSEAFFQYHLRTADNHLNFSDIAANDIKLSCMKILHYSINQYLQHLLEKEQIE
jgi:hypothetical protein